MGRHRVFQSSSENLTLSLQRFHCLGKERNPYYLACVLPDLSDGPEGFEGEAGMLCIDCSKTSSCFQRFIYFFNLRTWAFSLFLCFCEISGALFRHLSVADINMFAL